MRDTEAYMTAHGWVDIAKFYDRAPSEPRRAELHCLLLGCDGCPHADVVPVVATGAGRAENRPMRGVVAGVLLGSLFWGALGAVIWRWWR